MKKKDVFVWVLNSRGILYASRTKKQKGMMYLGIEDKHKINLKKGECKKYRLVEVKE